MNVRRKPCIPCLVIPLLLLLLLLGAGLAIVFAADIDDSSCLGLGVCGEPIGKGDVAEDCDALCWLPLIALIGLFALVAIVLFFGLFLLYRLGGAGGVSLAQLVELGKLLMQALPNLRAFASGLRAAAEALDQGHDVAQAMARLTRESAGFLGESASRINDVSLPGARWELQEVPPSGSNLYYVTVSPDEPVRLFGGVHDKINEAKDDLRTVGDETDELAQRLGAAAKGLREAAEQIESFAPPGP